MVSGSGPAAKTQKRSKWKHPNLYLQNTVFPRSHAIQFHATECVYCVFHLRPLCGWVRSVPWVEGFAIVSWSHSITVEHEHDPPCFSGFSCCSNISLSERRGLRQFSSGGLVGWLVGWSGGYHDSVGEVIQSAACVIPKAADMAPAPAATNLCLARMVQPHGDSIQFLSNMPHRAPPTSALLRTAFHHDYASLALFIQTWPCSIPQASVELRHPFRDSSLRSPGRARCLAAPAAL